MTRRDLLISQALRLALRWVAVAPDGSDVEQVRAYARDLLAVVDHTSNAELARFIARTADALEHYQRTHQPVQPAELLCADVGATVG